MSSEAPTQIWDVVKDWEAQHAGKHVTVAIPTERTDAPDSWPLVPDASYFRLLLCAVSLGNDRAWYTEWYPVVQSAVRLELGGERITLGHAARVPVVVNHPLSDPAPYGGGTLDVTAALLALKGNGDLDAALAVLGGLATNIEAGADAVAQVAEQVATRMQELMRVRQGEVHIGLHLTFTNSDGKTLPNPGYFAAIFASADEVKADQLQVVQDRLYWRALPNARAEPFTDHAYMLFRIEAHPMLKAETRSVVDAKDRADDLPPPPPASMVIEANGGTHANGGDASAGGSPTTLFSAYPAVDAPEQVAPEAAFDVTVGFRSDLDPHLTDLQRIALENVKADDRLLVTLNADGVKVLGKDFDTLALGMNATCTFKCQVLPGVGSASLSVKYFYGYQLVGMATRALNIVSGPAPAAPAAPAAAANDANPCHISLPLPPESATDLQVFISQQSDGSLQWQLVAPTPPTNLSPKPKAFDEQSAREFAHRLIDEMNASSKGPLGANALESMGQSIADSMPDEFFTVLRDVYQAIGKRPPSVLLLLERESYVPWELALLPQPLDPALPAFLGAQAVVGRWIQNDKIMLPPPVTLDLNKMTVVAGSYGGTSLPALKHALDEQAALHQAYAADEVEATLAALLPLIQNKTPGHLIHFVVHGTSDPAMNDQALLLTKGQIRPSELMGSHRCGTEPRFAFVFLNACQVGTAGSNLGQAAGFPGDLIRGGAAGFIGPLWSVSDDIASQWAQDFYAAALAQPARPIGEIMRDQRKAYQPGADNTPLAYLYYGHPNMRLNRRW